MKYVQACGKIIKIEALIQVKVHEYELEGEVCAQLTENYRRSSANCGQEHSFQVVAHR